MTTSGKDTRLTTELIRTLNAATDLLGPEHSVQVRTARTDLRNTYLHARSLVIGSTKLDPVDLRDMDALDGMVARWINDAQDAWTRAKQAKEAVDAATEGEHA